MKELYCIEYELEFNGTFKKIKGTATEIILTEKEIEWKDFRSDYIVKHEVKNIRYLNIM